MRFVDEQTRSQSETLRQLVLAVERLAGARSTAEVVETLRTSARNLVSAEGICIVLRDNGKCHYVEEDAIKPLWKGGKFPLETCISGWAMLNGKTAVIPDVFVDDRIPHAIYRETFVKSLVMTPIGHGDSTAALGAYWARNYQAPPEVIDTLATLARAAATALENVYLFGALNSSLKKMELARDELRHRLGNALSAIDSFGETTLQPAEARDLSTRIKALARAHQLANDSFALDGTVEFRDVVAAELEPYRNNAEARIDLNGPDLAIPGAQAFTLALVLNDLAVQAAKSGALRSPSASLTVRWRQEGAAIRLEWQQVFGSSASASAYGNLGSRTARNLISSQLSGTSRQVVNGSTITMMIEFAVASDTVFPENIAAE